MPIEFQSHTSVVLQQIWHIYTQYISKT